MNSTNIYLKDQNQRAKTKADFSNRLTKILIEKGKCSSRASKIADPKFLATLVNCSVVMARRYLLGQSIPTESNLKKISEWANVDPAWLLYGNTKTNIHNAISNATNNLIDKDILIEILMRLRPYLSDITLNDENFKDYISFAIDIYENVYHLDIEFNDKIKMLELMIKSIKFSKDKENKNTAAI